MPIAKTLYLQELQPEKNQFALLASQIEVLLLKANNRVASSSIYGDLNESTYIT